MADEVDSDDIRQVSQALNLFTYEFFYRVASDGPGKKNLFMSPFNISCALMQLHLGASGRSYDEVVEALRFEDPTIDFHAAFGALQRQLLASQGCILTLANSIWVEASMPLAESFKEQTKLHYRSEGYNVDINHHPDEARDSVNRWIENETNGIFKGVIQPGELRPGSTKLLVVSCIYFKANWMNRFSQASLQPFLTPNGEKQVPTMSLATLTEVVRTDQFVLVDIWYKGNDTKMVAILPSDDTALKNLCHPERLAKAVAIGRTGVSKINLKLPRFTVMCDVNNASSVLANLGMQSLFSPQTADFSGLTENPDDSNGLYVQKVIHSAFCKVDETGTEAGAVSVFKTGKHGAGPVPVHFNRPFFVAIISVALNTTLFLGLITDPTTTS